MVRLSSLWSPTGEHFSLYSLLRTATDDPPAWWTSVEHDSTWQSGVFFILAIIYGLIAIVALVQLIRIQLRVPEYGWTTQKMFHLLNFLVCLVRMSVFVLRLLFSTTYTLLVLFWAEIYHQARTLPTGNLRPTFIAFNVLVYTVQVGIWFFIGTSKNSSLRFAYSLSAAFMGVVALAAASGFIIYGGRLFLMLRSFPIDSRGRRKKIQEVGFVASICTFCFLTRAGMVFYAAFDPRDGNLDVMTHPLLNLIYYCLVELLPSALVLYILRKLPPKRSSQGYQSISTN